jgi:hypothetical protein
MMAGLCLGTAAEAQQTPESQWASLAPSAGLATVLTPAEEQCYRDLPSCFNDLGPDDTPARYYVTRLYFHIAQRVNDGTLKPKNMPVAPKEYDKVFMSPPDQKIVDDAIFLAIMGMIGG